MNIGENTEMVKTLEGWQSYAESHKEARQFTDYCKPYDLVDESIYDYFLDILPPRVMTMELLQVGEPAGMKMNWKKRKYQETYCTFRYTGIISGKRIWIYCGNCFVGDVENADTYRPYTGIREFLKNTYHERLNPNAKYLSVNRQRVICKDFFSMSVQASEYHYCIPRMTLQDGNYAACEVGFPSSEEEMLLPYAENPKEPMETVYALVPVEVIDQIIEKHGGFFDASVPVV